MFNNLVANEVICIANKLFVRRIDKHIADVCGEITSEGVLDWANAALDLYYADHAFTIAELCIIAKYSSNVAGMLRVLRKGKEI